MRPKTKIHFVCRGNIYRSRLAEAYTKSLKGSDWQISSSGIDKDRLPNRTLSPWAKAIAHEHSFDSHFSKQSAQTTAEILNNQDLVIFMRSDLFDDALKRYDFNPDKCLVWDIKDREDWPRKLSVPERRKRTFKHLRRNIENLIADIEKGGWVDIVDYENTPLGYALPIVVAARNGLWHRSCHAIISTPSGRTLVQKRAQRIIFAPGLIDISLGGHLDQGEGPEEAAKREIQEETGLVVNRLELLEVHKFSNYHPRFKRYTKCFVYTYHAPLVEEHPQLTPQKTEVSLLTFLTTRDLHKLLLRRRIKGLGRLNYQYAFYRKNIERAGL